jgi:hypothetical protein
LIDGECVLNPAHDRVIGLGFHGEIIWLHIDPLESQPGSASGLHTKSGAIAGKAKT